jgi:POT family proton-dependent oligopeptide transporter
MTPQWGFVIAACTALVLLLAFGGIGVSMQLDRARGLHPMKRSTACARCCAS